MKFYSAIAASTALLMATTAHGEAHEESTESDGPSVYTMNATFETTMMVGGVGGEGDQVFAAAWAENITISSPAGSNEITAQCAGMDQPANSLFDRHFTCTMEDGGGQSGAVLYGCNVENDAANEMSCVGYFQGKEGAIAGKVHLMTAYYWFMADGTGKMEGSGHALR
ncbi:hypothetical protein [Erythrobacter sp. Alg231-14]|uniref:hypothetical protein n=1 Tax=Erythrobacter sp. Alg231-14 TaxID=1922225 RepID=UPI000D55DB9D